MQSIDEKAIAKIKKAKRGSLFFAKDFLSFGSAKSVAKALERMVKRGEVSRVERGFYTRLETPP
jgi:hypothetical protein